MPKPNFKILSKSVVQDYKITAAHEHMAILAMRIRDLVDSHEIMRETVLDLTKQLDKFMQMTQMLMNYEKEVKYVTLAIEKFKKEIEL